MDEQRSRGNHDEDGAEGGLRWTLGSMESDHEDWKSGSGQMSTWPYTGLRSRLSRMSVLMSSTVSCNGLLCLITMGVRCIQVDSDELGITVAGQSMDRLVEDRIEL